MLRTAPKVLVCSNLNDGPWSLRAHVRVRTCTYKFTCANERSKLQLSAVVVLEADDVASSDDDGDDVMAPPVAAAGLSPPQVAPAAAAAGTDMYMY